MAGCSQLDAIVALGKNSKNLTDAAIKASSAAIALAAEACAIWFGGICGAISAAIRLHRASTGAINLALASDACCTGIAAITRANPSVTDARPSSSSSLSKVNRTSAMHLSVCSNSAANVDGSFKCRAHREHTDLNAKAARDHAGGCGKDDVMYIKTPRARAACAAEFAVGPRRPSQLA
jgi:hypothetical protein